MPDHDDVARLAVAIGRINRLIRPAGDGLSLGQLSALSTVVRRGPLKLGELAKAEQIAPPTVSRLIAELERRGFVERETDPDDRRSSFVSATAVGADAVLRARDERARSTRMLMMQLDEAQRAAVSAALGALETMAEAG